MTLDQRQRRLATVGLLTAVTLTALVVLAVDGQGRAPRAAGLSCSVRAPIQTGATQSTPPTTDGEPVLVPATPSVFVQAVVLSNDGQAATRVSCGGPSTQQLAPGHTLRFSVNEDVPVVLVDGHGHRCLYVGPRVPVGLGGLQPDGSQVIRTSQARPC
jgi:hypothetical protein